MPYTDNSISIPYRTGPAGGIPVIMQDRMGPRSPQAKPYCQPQTSPHSRTGMCIGESITPLFGMAWTAIGSTTQSAMQTAQVAIFLAGDIFSIVVSSFQYRLSLLGVWFSQVTLRKMHRPPQARFRFASHAAAHKSP